MREEEKTSAIDKEVNGVTTKIRYTMESNRCDEIVVGNGDAVTSADGNSVPAFVNCDFLGQRLHKVEDTTPETVRDVSGGRGCRGGTS